MWRCNHCVAKYVITTISNQKAHLKTVHDITETSRVPTDQKTIEHSLIQTKKSISSKALFKAIAQWIIDHCYSFNEVEAESFRKQ